MALLPLLPLLLLPLPLPRLLWLLLLLLPLLSLAPPPVPLNDATAASQEAGTAGALAVIMQTRTRGVAS